VSDTCTGLSLVEKHSVAVLLARVAARSGIAAVR